MLTSQQLHSFHTNGYWHLPEMIPLPLFIKQAEKAV
jgi:hypothetical protein